MKKTIFSLITITLFALSCKKDKTDPVDPVGNKPYTNMNYQTRWTYDVKTQDPATGDTTAVTDTATVSDRDTTVAQGTADQRTYKVITHTSGANSYLNISGNDYYQYQDVAALGVQVQALYLKDNVDVNGTWTQNETVTVPGIPIPLTLTFTSTIFEKGGSRTVNGITYNDIIGVSTTLTVPGLPVTSDIKNYYARNIGLIEGSYDIDATGVTSLHTKTQIINADLH